MKTREYIKGIVHAEDIINEINYDLDVYAGFYKDIKNEKVPFYSHSNKGMRLQRLSGAIEGLAKANSISKSQLSRYPIFVTL